MNKIFIVLVIAIIVTGGYLFLKKTPELVSQPSAEKTPVAEEKVITYTDAGYSPSPLQITSMPSSLPATGPSFSPPGLT